MRHPRKLVLIGALGALWVDFIALFRNICTTYNSYGTHFWYIEMYMQCTIHHRSLIPSPSFHQPVPVPKPLHIFRSECGFCCGCWQAMTILSAAFGWVAPNLVRILVGELKLYMHCGWKYFHIWLLSHPTICCFSVLRYLPTGRITAQLSCSLSSASEVCGMHTRMRGGKHSLYII